jgi:uncharacterized spore protein YtfJ
MAAEDAIRATVDELLKAISAKNIIGDPIETEDKIIIPVTKMGMGFGTGINHGTSETKNGEIAGGAGGGVGVFPVAVVVIFKGITGPDGIRMIPLTTPGPLAESMVHIANAVMDRLSNKKQSLEKGPAQNARINVE